MDKKVVRIQKQQYRTDQYKNVVDTEFKTFTKPVAIVDTDTIEELFRLYDKLYFSIPKEGENNSHQYLIRRSSELVEFEKDLENIQPLLDEIAQLREQLLQANQEIFDLQQNG